MSSDKSFDKLRKIVVIKNIPSNYIEEAIFILRSDENTEENLKKKDSLISDETMKDSNYLIKEAQNIINDYIRECREKESRINIFNNKQLRKLEIDRVGRKTRKKISLNGIIYIILTGSIIAFIYFLIHITTYY